MTSYGNTDLGQAINWTSVDLSSVSSNDNQLRAIQVNQT